MRSKLILGIKSGDSVLYHSTISINNAEVNIIKKQEIPKRCLLSALEFIDVQRKRGINNNCKITEIEGVLYDENGIEQHIFFDKLLAYFNQQL